ncbi:MAG: 6-phosphogluconolactonase [Jatrophihabitans sp.]|uniref:6-phosphogluconolactonase n=1 Tax=Jatrophihabitans sp. TaxID=1932789 RepID=UPI00390E36D7
MTTEPEVVVEESATALADRVADLAVATLSAALDERGVAHLVITGGGILEKVLAALAARKPIDWSQVHVWWGDERYVPADSADRNDLPAKAALLDQVAVDPSKVHRMPPSDAGFGEDVEAAAASYAAELAEAAAGHAEVPTFDLVLLGVGPDGHCASLFPGHPALHESAASVVAVHDSPKPPPTRLSLTFPALDAANEIWFVASGDGKADAVSRALGGADFTDVPSARPRGREHTLWLLDRDAAAKLRG